MDVAQALVEAIHRRRLVEFEYRERHRVVEPTTFGVNATGVRQLLVYQVGGASQSGALPDWPRFDVAGIDELALRQDSFFQRAAPTRKHTDWREIIAFVPAPGEHA